MPELMTLAKYNETWDRKKVSSSEFEHLSAKTKGSRLKNLLKAASPPSSPNQSSSSLHLQESLMMKKIPIFIKRRLPKEQIIDFQHYRKRATVCYDNKILNISSLDETINSISQANSIHYDQKLQQACTKETISHHNPRSHHSYSIYHCEDDSKLSSCFTNLAIKEAITNIRVKTEVNQLDSITIAKQQVQFPLFRRLKSSKLAKKQHIVTSKSSKHAKKNNFFMNKNLNKAV